MLCNSAVKNRRATCRISALNFPYEFDILIGLRRIQLYRTSKKHDVSWLVLTAIVFGSHSHSRRNRDSGLARPIKCIWNFGFTHSIASSPHSHHASAATSHVWLSSILAPILAVLGSPRRARVPSLPVRLILAGQNASFFAHSATAPSVLLVQLSTLRGILPCARRVGGMLRPPIGRFG